MFPLEVKHHWMFAIILFVGLCESSDKNDCRTKNVLFASAGNCNSPSEAVYKEVTGTKLCLADKTEAECCPHEEFDCSFKISGSEQKYSLVLKAETLSKQDIVLLTDCSETVCLQQMLTNTSSDLFLNIHTCLNKDVKQIRFSHNSLCEESSYSKDECRDLAETSSTYKFIIGNNGTLCVNCDPYVSITLPPPESISLENAAVIMNNLSSLLEQMGNSSRAFISMGHIKGAITKLPPNNAPNISFGIKTSGEVNIFEDGESVTGFPRSVRIPAEASVMAVEQNGSFAAAVLFPGMLQEDPNSFFVNDEIVGIEMGTEVSNLSHTIDIHYRSVSKNGRNASCRSWDGKGKEVKWITDGCQTKEINDSITCQCSHLTFFAILLSSPPGNISSSHFKSLSYITSVGCGLSIFFLTVALFMYCLVRKGKASQANRILMNLFVAMVTLNLSFLVNESVAELGNFGACVAVAAVMHYTMLATFTWFFMEALHLLLKLWKFPTNVKHYMMKICVTGWVTPAAVVTPLLAFRQYDHMVISTDDGKSASMCWISDAVVHQGVNVGYYTVVFLFTFVTFVMTVRQIALFKPTAGNAKDTSSIRASSFSILGLFLMFGITWASAFFSHGPLLIASYYIFTILNSFQGFFLFIYYCHSRKTVGEERRTTSTGSSSTTLNTVVTPPH